MLTTIETPLYHDETLAHVRKQGCQGAQAHAWELGGGGGRIMGGIDGGRCGAVDPQPRLAPLFYCTCYGSTPPPPGKDKIRGTHTKAILEIMPRASDLVLPPPAKDERRKTKDESLRESGTRLRRLENVQSPAVWSILKRLWIKDARGLLILRKKKLGARQEARYGSCSGAKMAWCSATRLASQPSSAVNASDVSKENGQIRTQGARTRSAPMKHS